MPEIIEDKCDGCGLCISVCHCNAFIHFGKIVRVVEVDSCLYCTDCELVCPTGAIVCRYEIIFEEDA